MSGIGRQRAERHLAPRNPSGLRPCSPGWPHDLCARSCRPIKGRCSGANVRPFAARWVNFAQCTPPLSVDPTRSGARAGRSGIGATSPLAAVSANDEFPPLSAAQPLRWEWLFLAPNRSLATPPALSRSDSAERMCACGPPHLSKLPCGRRVIVGERPATLRSLPVAAGGPAARLLS